MSGRRRAATAVAVTLAVIVLLLLARFDDPRSVADELASVGSFLFAALTAAVTWRLVGGGRAGGSDEEQRLDRAARALAATVRRQWRDEAAVRGLRHDRPLQLHWVVNARPEPEAGTSTTESGGDIGGLRGITGDLVAAGDPPAAQLLGLCRSADTRTLVILGAAGSGKTSVATLLTLTGAEDASAGNPVPVLLSATGWDPAEPVHDWVAHRLAEEYPDVTGTGPDGRALARDLVEHARVWPVLDGVDELDDTLHTMALSALDRASGHPAGFVVTCRTREFATAEHTEGPVSGAVVVTLESVTADDAIAYLAGAGSGDSDRWASIAEHLRAEPNGDLAAALSTPLTISIARTVYRAPADDPRELIRLARSGGAGAVTDMLLDRFLITVYTPVSVTGATTVPYRPDQARTWLASLTRRMSATTEANSFAWWRLAGTMPAAVQVGVPALLIIALSGAVAAAIGAANGDPALDTGISGLFTGGPFGLVAGRVALRSARRRDRPGTPVRAGALAVAGASLRDSCAVGLAALILIVAGHALARAGLDTGAVSFVDEAASLILLAMIAGGVSGLLLNSMALSRPVRPQRLTPRLRDLPRRLGEGTLAAALFTVPFGLIMGLTAGIWQWPYRQPPSWLFQSALFTAGTYAGPTTLCLGLVLGAGRWITHARTTPDDPAGPNQAADSLRAERIALLAAAGAAAVCSAVPAAVFATVFNADPNGPDLAEVAAVAAGFTCPAVFMLCLVGSGSPFPAYTLACCWFAVTGRLPLRLMPFLIDARRRGVLRQTGSVYQFRHDILRRHLDPAAPGAAPRGGQGPVVEVKRRRIPAWIPTALSFLVILVVIVLNAVPSASYTLQVRLEALTCANRITVYADPAITPTAAVAADQFNRQHGAPCQMVTVRRHDEGTVDVGRDAVRIHTTTAELNSIDEPVASAGRAPLALSLPADTGARLTDADPDVTWADILAYARDPLRWRQVTGGDRLTVVIPDPRRSPVGLHAVLGIYTAAAGEAPLSYAHLDRPEVTATVRAFVTRHVRVAADDTRRDCPPDDWGTVALVVAQAGTSVRVPWTAPTCPGGAASSPPWVTVPITDARPLDFPVSIGREATWMQRETTAAFAQQLTAIGRRYGLQTVRYTPMPDGANMSAAVRADWTRIRRAVTVLFAVDTSEAMAVPLRPGGNDTRMQAARRAIAAAAAGFGDQDRFGVRTFAADRQGRPVTSWLRAVAPPGADAGSRLALLTSRTGSRGMSLTQVAMDGYRYLCDTVSPGQPVALVVITTGPNTRSAAVASNSAGTGFSGCRGVQIYVVALGGQVTEEMEALAGSSRGRAVAVDAADEVDQAVQQAAGYW